MKELFWIEHTMRRFKDGYNYFGRHPEKVITFFTSTCNERAEMDNETFLVTVAAHNKNGVGPQTCQVSAHNVGSFAAIVGPTSRIFAANVG
jgi:hypothetical protein